MAERVPTTPAIHVCPRPPLDRSSEAAADLLSTMIRRRTIKRLRPGPLSEAALDRILAAVRLTPSAFNRPAWHLLVVRDRHAAFWEMVASAVRDHLNGDRRERYLARVDGFRSGVLTALVYEDLAARDALQSAWDVTADRAHAYAEQGLGMVQLALWLAVTAEGLATSLQHLEWLIEDRAAAFFDLPPERYRLVATMPIGYADEVPLPSERSTREESISYDWFAGHSSRGGSAT
jgi:predicted oxidoreductase (fatty acid repression mutant protein)